MKSFDAIQVSDRLARAFDEGPREDDIVFEVRPPIDSDGIQSSLDLFTAFHRIEEDGGVLRNRNDSGVCGLEIWYENEAFQFVFYVPNETENAHYRKQLSGHFPGIAIDDKVERENKFLSVDPGDYVATTRLILNKHYFEPIGNPSTNGEGEVDYDPYQTLLSEANTKDATETVIQFLYKPALDGWTNLRWNSAKSYAETLEEEGKSNPRYFGSKYNTIENEDARQAGAREIRQQANKQGFHLEARILVTHPEKATAETQLSSLVDMFKSTYRSQTEQTLIGEQPKNQEALIAKMIRRQEENLSVPSGLSGFLSAQWNGCRRTMVMTISELTGLVHLPSAEEIDIDDIDWADRPVQGTLPPNAEVFEPVSPQEVKEKLTQEELEQVLETDPDHLHEFTELITEEHAGEYDIRIDVGGATDPPLREHGGETE